MLKTEQYSFVAEEPDKRHIKFGVLPAYSYLCSKINDLRLF